MGKNYFTSELSELIAPSLLSNFKQRLKDKSEHIYASNKQYPLGRGPPPDIPQKVIDSTFGCFSESGDSAACLIRPPDIIPFGTSMYAEHYDLPKQFNEEKLNSNVSRSAGVTYVYDTTGAEMKKVLTMRSHNKQIRILPLLPGSSEQNFEQDLENSDLQEQYKPPKYMVMNKDETYGTSDPVKVEAKRYTKEQNLVEALWNMLKMKNYTNFKDFATAFKTYDRKGVGKISAEDIQVMCQKFGISVPIQIIQKLVAECDILDKDGLINYQEFIHCLNWKDILPEKLNKKVEKYSNDWRQGINNPSEETLDHYRTASSKIGEHTLKVPQNIAGIPSFRTDKIAPRMKKLSDSVDYGDIKNASVVIQPNLFAEHGVYEKDLAKLWSKLEILMFLKKCGYLIEEKNLDSVWRSKNGRASIGTILNALKQECF